jgi:hypothetical protein
LGWEGQGGELEENSKGKANYQKGGNWDDKYQWKQDYYQQKNLWKKDYNQQKGWNKGKGKGKHSREWQPKVWNPWKGPKQVEEKQGDWGNKSEEEEIPDEVLVIGDEVEEPGKAQASTYVNPTPKKVSKAKWTSEEHDAYSKRLKILNREFEEERARKALQKIQEEKDAEMAAQLMEEEAIKNRKKEEDHKKDDKKDGDEEKVTMGTLMEQLGKMKEILMEVRESKMGEIEEKKGEE